MTLIVALECRDGLVMASESQESFVTAGGQPTKGGPISKLDILAKSIMWGGSGHVGSIQRVHAELDKQAGNVTREFGKGREAGAKELHKYVNEVQRQVAKELLVADQSYETGFLFAGYAKDGPYILECDRKGAREWHHGRHFAAIGSGDIFAMHAWRSVEHHNISALALAQGEALAYRTVENAVATAAFGLGGAVQICVVMSDREPHLLSREEMQATEDMVKLWKAREIEVLGELALAPEQRAAAAEAAAKVEPPPKE